MSLNYFAEEKIRCLEVKVKLMYVLCIMERVMRIRSKVIFGMILSCVSFTALASEICELDNWCTLLRSGDSAEINVYDKTEYICTLSVNGKYDGSKIVKVNVSGDLGFQTTPIVLIAHQGESIQAYIKGTFSDPNNGDPIIKFDRQTNDGANSTNKKAYVMCTERSSK